MTVLDRGSGKRATSVFLVREFGVRVIACDHWVSAETAAVMLKAAGVADRVTAVNAEAHNLPFERDASDAVVSVDAFEYLGTADNYLYHLLRFLRPAGQLASRRPRSDRRSATS